MLAFYQRKFCCTIAIRWWLSVRNKSNATNFDTINATTRPCGELWLVEDYPHMDSPSPLHQPQLATWASCSICCAKMCGTRLILLLLVRCIHACVGSFTSLLYQCLTFCWLKWHIIFSFLTSCKLGLALLVYRICNRVS